MRFLFRILIFLLSIIAASAFLYAEKPTRAQAQSSSGSKRLATVDGVPITETQARMEGAKDLDALELQTLKAKAVAARNEHQILEEALDRIIEEKLLRAEAEKRGISKEDLLSMEVEQKVSEPTPAEIDAFYTENQQRIARPKEEAAPQISRYLKQQRERDIRESFFEKLEKEHRVERLQEPLRYDVNAAGRPSAGSASAPVLLVLFSDFQCPYCKRFSGTIKEVLKQYGPKVHLVFRQFPLTDIHANAQKAAEASLCADAQGHFWEMHDLLFQNQGNLRDQDLKDRASRLGLDVSAFNTCLDSGRYGGKIEEDIRAGSAAGVEGTPALFVNGRFLYGSRPYEEVAKVIDEELKTKK